MDDSAIRISSLSKRYRLGTFTYGRLTESISSWVRRPFRAKSRPSAEWIWALRDVSLDVHEGESLGIIGRNGAGKTTLLKILSRITEPTEGRVTLHGRVSSLLEVGTGFHPELTGQENIFLNGAILGMRSTEIKRKFDDIVEFSELDRFLDTPVKRYSSGMYVRLAFAVAAHLEPDILIVDEVLAVGDAAFQAKCLGKMDEVARQGRTVLFVTHNMSAVTRLCTRACWIDKGRVREDGSPTEVVGHYLSSGVSTGTRWVADDRRESESELQLVAAEVRNEGGESASAVRYDERFYIDVTYRLSDSLRDAAVLIRLTDLSGNIVLESWDTDADKNRHVERSRGDYTSTCVLPSALLKPGRYWLSIGAHIPNARELDRRDHILAFDVSPGGSTIISDRRGVIVPVFDWEVAATEGKTGSSR